MNYLYRDELLKVEKMWNKNLNNQEYYNMLEQFLNKLNSYEYENDDNYLLNSRRKNCIETINKNILNKGSIVDIMWAFWEFISNEYGGFASLENEFNKSRIELETMDSNYRNKKIICLKEKEDILNLINKIKNYISK